ncbi:hypothetical protein RNS86_12890 [Staphylococcus pseudintermedius]|nr:hypothetical protein [Staphylococcus pseudintermedius]
MFDIGFSEVFVIAIVALIVLGPEHDQGHDRDHEDFREAYVEHG